jgi:hypothetical protein
MIINKVLIGSFVLWSILKWLETFPTYISLPFITNRELRIATIKENFLSEKIVSK